MLNNSDSLEHVINIKNSYKEKDWIKEKEPEPFVINITD